MPSRRFLLTLNLKFVHDLLNARDVSSDLLDLRTLASAINVAF